MSEQEYAHPYSELLLKTLDAYQASIMEDLFRTAALGHIQCWTPPKPIGKWQRRKNRLRYKWRRLTGWRLRWQNTNDDWHKRGDCLEW